MLICTVVALDRERIGNVDDRLSHRAGVVLPIVGVSVE